MRTRSSRAQGVLHHPALAPHVAEPLALALCAGLALLGLGWFGVDVAALALVTAVVVALRVRRRSSARSPLAVVLPSRRWLEGAALGAALGVSAAVVVRHAAQAKRWLWVLDGWRDPSWWLLQLVIPAVAGLWWLRRSAGGPTPTPYFQAWLFGHRPLYYAGGFALRAGLAPAVLTALFALSIWGASDTGRQARAAVARFERIEAAQGAAGEAAVRAAWQGWQGQAAADRLAVAALLPRLLLAEGGPSQAVVDAWLSPFLRGAARPALLDTFASAAALKSARAPRDAVLVGLRAQCARALALPADTPDDEGTAAAAQVGIAAACAPLARTDFGRLQALGVDQRAQASRLSKAASTLGLGYHDLLGPWARARGLCAETLAQVGWRRQLALVYRAALCHGAEGPAHHARAVAQAFRADAHGAWLLPGGRGATLGAVPRDRGCAKGPCVLLRRPQRALRDTRALIRTVAAARATEDRWQGQTLHLWSYDAAGAAVWAGAATLGSEPMAQAHCVPRRRSKRRKGRGEPSCPPIYGARLHAEAGAAGPTLRLARVSSEVPGCDQGDVADGCLDPSDEGKGVVSVSWVTRGDASSRHTLTAAQLLAGDWPAARASRATRRAVERLRNGELWWLAALLRSQPHGPPPTLMVRLAGGALRTLQLRGVPVDGRLPVVRLLLRQRTLQQAAAGPQWTCTKAAAAVGLVQPKTGTERWHETTATGPWFKRRLGGLPDAPLCVLAPLVAVQPPEVSR